MSFQNHFGQLCIKYGQLAMASLPSNKNEPNMAPSTSVTHPRPDFGAETSSIGCFRVFSARFTEMIDTVALHNEVFRAVCSDSDDSRQPMLNVGGNFPFSFYCIEPVLRQLSSTKGPNPTMSAPDGPVDQVRMALLHLVAYGQLENESHKVKQNIAYLMSAMYSHNPMLLITIVLDIIGLSSSQARLSLIDTVLDIAAYLLAETSK